MTAKMRVNRKRCGVPGQWVAAMMVLPSCLWAIHAGSGYCGQFTASLPNYGMTPNTPTKPDKTKPETGSAPAFADLHYGPEARQTMDVWLPRASQPVPCVIYIHGGGWLIGSKDQVAKEGLQKPYLREGLAVVAINYRYAEQTIIDTGSTEGRAPLQPRGDYAQPPVRQPLYDAARAVQFVRSRAAEWGIDPNRIGLTGSSAGACTSLWLAFHDDLADPQAADPVLRQSTRPYCVAVNEAQTTLDPVQMVKWTPNSIYGGHAFGYVWDRSDKTAEFRSFLKDHESVRAWIDEYSPYALASAEDPPVYLHYGDGAPARGQPRKDPTHTANFGALLVEKLDRLGVPYELVHPGVANPRHLTAQAYLIETLKR